MYVFVFLYFIMGSHSFSSSLQQKSVTRRKCAACKIVAHTVCIEQLDKVTSLSHVLLLLTDRTDTVQMLIFYMYFIEEANNGVRLKTT